MRASGWSSWPAIDGEMGWELLAVNSEWIVFGMVAVGANEDAVR